MASMSASAGARAAVVVAERGSDPRLLCLRRPESDPSYPGFGALPTAEVHAADVSYVESPELAPKVAGLRALFVETGWLFAAGDPVDEAEGRALRVAFAENPAEGLARLRARGLRLRVEEVVALGRREVNGDLPEAGTVALFRIAVERFPESLLLTTREGTRLEPIALHSLRSDWREGRILLAPPLDGAIRELEGGLSAESFGRLAAFVEVVPGIRTVPLRTPTPPPATHTNAYVVGTGEAVLVEPASPHPDEVGRLVELVDALESKGLVFRAILATHHHHDHVGGAVAVARRLGLPLWAHAETAARLRGRVHFERAIADGERLELEGTEPMSLEAVHTPGHAPGHLCFRDRGSGAMIAGDMVAGVGTVLVDPSDGDMALYLDSLRKMAAFEPTVLFPAHGGPIADPAARLAHYAAHRQAREERILAALRDQKTPVTAWDLLPHAYADAPRRAWPYAAMTAESHLVKLAREGRAERRGRAWVAV